MSLLEKYNGATAGNAFLSRTTQVSDTNIKNGVNFMDAGVRNTTTDQFQTEFKRNAPGTKTWTPGIDTDYAASDQKGLSRWYGRALNYAFIDPNATGSSIKDSVWKYFKMIRKTEGSKDTWLETGNEYFHRYTPKTNFGSTLTGLAQTRALQKKVKAN